MRRTHVKVTDSEHCHHAYAGLELDEFDCQPLVLEIALCVSDKKGRIAPRPHHADFNVLCLRTRGAEYDQCQRCRSYRIFETRNDQHRCRSIVVGLHLMAKCWLPTRYERH